MYMTTFYFKPSSAAFHTNLSVLLDGHSPRVAHTQSCDLYMCCPAMMCDPSGEPLARRLLRRRLERFEDPSHTQRLLMPFA